jgi:hypothetical protein
MTCAMQLNRLTFGLPKWEDRATRAPLDSRCLTVGMLARTRVSSVMVCLYHLQTEEGIERELQSCDKDLMHKSNYDALRNWLV